PRGCLGRDTVGLLAAALADQGIALDQDMVDEVGGAGMRIDAVDTGDALAVDGEILQSYIAGVGDLNGVAATGCRVYSGRRSGGGTGDGDPGAGRAVQSGDDEIRIIPGGKVKRITWSQTRQKGDIGGWGGVINGGLRRSSGQNDTNQGVVNFHPDIPIVNFRTNASCAYYT